MLLLVLIWQAIFNIFFSDYITFRNIILGYKIQSIQSNDKFPSQINREVYWPEDIYLIDVDDRHKYFLAYASQ